MHGVFSCFFLLCCVDMQADEWNSTAGEAGFSKLTRGMEVLKGTAAAAPLAPNKDGW